MAPDVYVAISFCPRQEAESKGNEQIPVNRKGVKQLQWHLTCSPVLDVNECTSYRLVLAGMPPVL